MTISPIRFVWQTSLGALALTGMGEKILRIELPKDSGEGGSPDSWKSWFKRYGFSGVESRDERPPGAFADSIESYLSGELRTFNLPLELLGTPFQKRVWDALISIPYGEVQTYGAIARRVDSPGGSRAVGMACGANPIPLIVPCHRVIAKGGKIGGFAGGLVLKRFLLDLELPLTHRPLPFAADPGTFHIANFDQADSR